MYLYHYFDKTKEPFLSLSDLSKEEAKKVRDNHNRLQAEKEGREYKYDENEFDTCGWENRHVMENNMREKFATKGGQIHRKYPYYLILRNDDMSDEAAFHDGNFIKIPAEKFDMSVVSFTYGDSAQIHDPGTFSDKPYWNNVFTFAEILEIIKEYGWITKSDNWNWCIPCYIEAQLWSDIPIEKYRKSYNVNNHTE